MLMIVNKSSG